MRSLMILCALCLAAGAALAGNLTPAMDTYLASKSADEPVSTLLLLDDHVDIKALDLDLHRRGVGFEERHRIVITTLQDKARRTQASLLADLEVRLQLGEIQSYEPFWILNGVFVTTGSADVVRDLAARSDVRVADTPLKIDLIRPSERGAAASSRGIGITPGVVNIGARRVWSDLGIDGTGRLVANLDTGVDGNHIALRDRWRGTHAPAEECWLDFVGGFNNPPVDSDSHGTHTMGTICGLAPDDTIGVAPGAEWIAANTIVGGSLGSQVLQTMQWLADPDGDPLTTDDVPDAACNSWGINENFGYPDCYSGWWDAIDACEAAGVMHVWAAGNEGPGAGTLRSPADRATTPYDSFSVGSTITGYPFTLAWDSSRGPAGPDCGPVENLIKPEVSAPGAGVYSSVPGSGYATYSGTSMATPHVTGAVALMRAANPDLDVVTIKQILMDTAVDLGVPGEDNLYGHGIIDVYEAVLAAMSGYGTIAGTVVDDDTGLPVSGAAVTVAGADRAAESDVDGSFRISLPVGTYTLDVTAFGYFDGSVEVEVAGSDDVVAEVRLAPQPTVTLSGSVFGPGDVYPEGTPAVGAVVLLEGTPLPAVTTLADGAWSITTPAEAQYTVRATLPGEGSCVQTLPATADLGCDLWLRATAGDGFESGDFGGLDWALAGAADWEVSADGPAEGNFTARSGLMAGGDTGILNLSTTLDEAGPVTFWVRTEGAGTLAFWDGYATIEEWTGQTQWVQYTYQATAGDHTFRWRYNADDGGAGDRGYLDGLVLPGGESPAPRALACPDVVMLEVAEGGVVDGTLLVLNQGVEDLTWSLTQIPPAASVAVDSGVLAPAGFTDVGLTVDATDLQEGEHWFNLRLLSDDPANGNIIVQVRVTVGDPVLAADDLPQAVTLVGAVPNPFNPLTTVRFALPADQHASLRVYDLQGRLVRELVDDVRPAGQNEARWDGRDRQGRAVASGTYFARLVSDGQVQVKSMVLVR